jgi:hypothetical protein
MLEKNIRKPLNQMLTILPNTCLIWEYKKKFQYPTINIQNKKTTFNNQHPGSTETSLWALNIGC